MPLPLHGTPSSPLSMALFMSLDFISTQLYLIYLFVDLFLKTFLLVYDSYTGGFVVTFPYIYMSYTPVGSSPPLFPLPSHSPSEDDFNRFQCSIFIPV
jgi:hypothetical protein